ncbi:MAG: hypothetical protein B7Z55_06655 [Planctomycetales bacterium 12-60-4]|nr:MAG: hypothetical protein B7Z55_06655 [Planctomycetales bacterium 12-60-4]
MSPTFSPEGLTSYFASNRPNGQGGADIGSVRRDAPDAPFGKPQNLGPLVNSQDHETHFRPVYDGRAALLNRRAFNGEHST